MRVAGQIGKGAKAPTIRRDLGVLVAALNHAVKERRLKRADMPSIPMPEASQPRERWLTEAEVERLIALAEKRRQDGRLARIERFVTLAYYTASRKRAIDVPDALKEEAVEVLS